jgi:hypothetical protein
MRVFSKLYRYIAFKRLPIIASFSESKQITYTTYIAHLNYTVLVNKVKNNHHISYMFPAKSYYAFITNKYKIIKQVPVYDKPNVLYITKLVLDINWRTRKFNIVDLVKQYYVKNHIVDLLQYYIEDNRVLFSLTKGSDRFPFKSRVWLNERIPNIMEKMMRKFSYSISKTFYFDTKTETVDF